MNKRVFVLCFIIGLPLLIVILFYTFFLMPKQHFDISITSEQISHNYHNTIANRSSSLIQIDDKLYYNYRNGDSFRYGTYEITDSTTKRVYWEGPALSPRNISLDNVYHGQIAEDIETYLNTSTGSLYHVDSGIPQELKPNHSFVVNDVWYFYTLGNNPELYRMNGDKPELFVSADTLGEPEIPFKMYIDDSFIYYVSNMQNIENNGIARYSLKSGEAQSIYPDELKNIENALSSISCLFARNGKAYYLTNYNSIFETDFESGVTKLLYHSDDYISSVNMLDDTLFFSEDSENGGIYALSVTNGTIEELLSQRAGIKELYLLDWEYVYYNDYNENLFRIHRKTKEIERVFG
ncbi:MAG: hypothetical protein IJ598_06245 [Ruminococcus sp.]|nr:hypothetical protein [Ruminococcus sp.]